MSRESLAGQCWSVREVRAALLMVSDCGTEGVEGKCRRFRKTRAGSPPRTRNARTTAKVSSMPIPIQACRVKFAGLEDIEPAIDTPDNGGLAAAYANTQSSSKHNGAWTGKEVS